MTVVHRARGGWWHDFVCPTHGTELLGARGDAYLCTYGCELRGEPFASAWLVLEHQAAARSARAAAHRSRQSGDPAEQAAALDVIVAFADYYAEVTAEWNSDSESWMLQGKLFKQALTEAIWATQLADAIRVLADDPAARASMGAPVVSMLGALLDTIVEARRVLVVDRDDLTSNYVAWLDAAGSLLTRALAALGAEPAADGPWISNVVEHSAVAIGADGWEWEGSTYYHLFVLRAYLLAIGGEDPAALDPALLSRLRRMVEVLVDVAASDGRLPMLHDGPYDRTGVHLEVLEICALAGQLWEGTGLDTVEAWARRRIGEEYDGLEDLLHGWFGGRALAPDDATVPVSAARPSRLFADVGFAVLRSAGHPLQAVLDAGPHGGSHGHLDTLALYLFGDGIAWQPAPGVPPYGSALRRGHYARTTAHPTVRADDTDQRESTGVVEQWRVDAESTLVDASSTEAIHGVRLERRVEAIGGVLLDILSATALDGVARAFTSALRPAVPFEVIQDGSGWRTRWSGPFGRDLHGRHLADVDSQLVDAPGRGPSDDPAVPLAVGDWTATAPRVTFVSVFAEGSVSPIDEVVIDAGRLRVRLTDGWIIERELQP